MCAASRRILIVMVSAVVEIWRSGEVIVRPLCRPVFVEPTCPAAGQIGAWLSYVDSLYIMTNFNPMSIDIWTGDP